jgi:NAD+ kinase
MDILVVAKESNYEIHGPRVERYVKDGRVDPSVLRRLLIAHDQHYKTLETVRVALNSLGIGFEEISRKDFWPSQQRYSIIITVGGDGTVLYSAQHECDSKTLVVGVRSTDESVGFLCAFDRLQVAELARAVADGRLQGVPVQRLCAHIRFADGRQDVESLPVLNDLLYSNSNPALTTRYKISYGRFSEVQRSSGIWVATAIGSTAAILAAGGVVQDYQSTLFQFKPRELYRPPEHLSELDGSLFNPDEQSLDLENYCESAILALDGQHGSVNLGYGDKVKFKRSVPLNLVLSKRLLRPTI